MRILTNNFPIPLMGGPLPLPVIPNSSVSSPMFPYNGAQLLVPGSMRYGFGGVSAGGRLFNVIFNNFSRNSVSNFKNLQDASDKYDKIQQDLEDPNCVLNVKNGMAIWYCKKYKHFLKDVVCTPPIQFTLPGAGTALTVECYLSTTVIIAPTADFNALVIASSNSSVFKFSVIKWTITSVSV